MVDSIKPVFQIFPEAREAIKNAECPTCGKKIRDEDFKDDLSRTEYGISGMCQSCQDSVFG